MPTLTAPLRPVLAYSVDDDRQLEWLICSPVWIAQQKVDGVRCLVHVDDDRVTAYSRQGLVLPAVKHPVLDRFENLESTWVFDGEYLAATDTYWLFDLIVVEGKEAWRCPWHQRQEALLGISLLLEDGRRVRRLPVAEGTRAKRGLVRKVKEAGGEGVVFKLTTALYEQGKRSRNVLKAKNRHDLDAVVTAIGLDGKANMAIALWKSHGAARWLEPVGECGALAGDGPKVKPGDIVTITCHGVSKDDRIVQPTMPRIRTDKRSTDCTWDQLEPLRIRKTVLLP